MKKITICVTTHCIKTETRGPWAGVANRCPSMPSTKMIESVLGDLFRKIDLTIDDCYIHIGFDKRKGRGIDDEYHRNLQNLCDRIGGKLVVNESEIDDPIVTAPKNFTGLIDSVETDYYFLIEHDWVFDRFFSVKSILDELDVNDQINLVKFSQADSSMESALCAIIPEVTSEMILSLKPSNKIPLLYMCHYSNNPHICRTKIFQNWWTHYVYETSEWGGFVEGPMNLFMQDTAKRVGWTNTMKIFKLCVYGTPEEPRMIHHLNGNAWS